MGLDHFSTRDLTLGGEDIEVNIEDKGIEILPGDGEMKQGAVKTDNAKVNINGDSFEVNLEDETTFPVIEDLYGENFDRDSDQAIQEVIEQLAVDHIENKVLSQRVLEAPTEAESFISKDSRDHDILLAFYRGGILTRQELDEWLDTVPSNPKLRTLRDKQLITKVGKDGARNIYTVTPRGAVELLKHNAYSDLRLKKDAESEDEDEDEDPLDLAGLTVTDEESDKESDIEEIDDSTE